MNYVAGSLGHFRQAVRERRKEDDTRNKIEIIMKAIEDAVNEREKSIEVDSDFMTETISEMMLKEGYEFEDDGYGIWIISGWE